jgi:hypothetical protein
LWGIKSILLGFNQKIVRYKNICFPSHSIKEQGGMVKYYLSSYLGVGAMAWLYVYHNFDNDMGMSHGDIPMSL